MGIVSFFVKSPQKCEEKGDACFEKKSFGLAKLEYESALEKIRKKQPDDTGTQERLIEKLQNSKESLALQHLETGESLVDAGVMDEAEGLFRLALSLTENQGLHETLSERLKSLNVQVEEDEPEELQQPEQNRSEIESPNHSFELLCATLPDDTAQAYSSYGQTFQTGFLALSNGEFELAAEKLELALEENSSGDTLIPVEFATALIHLDQTDRAIELLNNYIETNPSSFHGISLLCDLLCDLGDFDAAHTLIDQSPADIRDSIAGLLHKGRIYYLEKKYTKAEANYQIVLDSVGWNDDVARSLAQTLDAAGKKEKAIDLYASLLNKCTGCGQRANPLDQKAFADLSVELGDYSEKTLKIFLDLADNYLELRSDCFLKASMIFNKIGNDKESIRFKKLAEETSL